MTYNDFFKMKIDEFSKKNPHAHIEKIYDHVTGSYMIKGLTKDNKPIMIHLSRLNIEDSPHETLMRNIELVFDGKLDLLSANDLNGIARMKNSAFLLISSFNLPENEIDKVVLAGGCFTSFFHNEMSKDLDVFILDDAKFSSSLSRALDYMPSDRKVESDLNYLNNDRKNIKRIVLDKLTKVQYIVTDYKTREELLNSFDAEHTCVSFVRDKLYFTKETFDCVKNKNLKPHKGNKIAAWRQDKFIKRGFTLATLSI